MKKLLSIIAVATLVLGAPHATFAASKKAKAEATPAATPEAKEGKTIPLYSEVSAIDAASKSWTHKNKDGKEVKFTVNDKTEIKNNGADAKFEDIKVGDWVSGSRKKVSDTEYEVVKITKFGAKTEKAEKKGEKAAATPAAEKKK